MSNNTLCIEDIMNEIRAEIKEKGLNSSMLSFEDIPYTKTQSVSSSDLNDDELKDVFIYLNNHYNIEPYKELGGNKLAVFVKKVIRKLVKFYVEPIVAEQNAYNAHTLRVLNSTKNNNISDLLNRLEALEISQKNLSLKIQTLENENKNLKATLGK